MIRSFAHKGLERFFKTGSKAGIRADQADRLARQLAMSNVARTPEEMDIPGWRLHPLKGDLAGYWSVWVSASWRLTFRFVGEDAEIVDYQDYH
ncbi:MAG: type II toxin-antitoxin system RelE/ParE family toxin [Trinickia sp.]|jgi:proteic killer suppression protein|uniref:type II toxin-antitoxin system RelE/ParE family toxin n=1 Tax=Trinickia sp. TaxID=2571163 RepID=UPI003F7F58C1